MILAMSQKNKPSKSSSFCFILFCDDVSKDSKNMSSKIFVVFYIVL